ncbi:MAG: type II toxin-antitoxin system prevent-host-death family antitoxin [Actinobacteria bacterium]|nr:type II toxin-antitoxin system prevent-host-death family antitoxin [Actinomycetota bacterium]
MGDVTIRELRNQTRRILERAHTCEAITITVDGRPAAELHPLTPEPRFCDPETFVSTILTLQADPGLAADLAELAPDTTDDLASLEETVAILTDPSLTDQLTDGGATSNIALDDAGARRRWVQEP